MIIRFVAALVLSLVAGNAYSATFDLFAESDTDTVGGSEFFQRTYASHADLLTDTKGPGGWSALDVGAGFSIAGIAFDGQYQVFAESDADAVGGSEVFVRTFATLADLLTDTKGPGGWSALDVGAGFSIAGVAFDGQYQVLAESDADTVGGSEVFVRTYATLADILTDTKGPGGWSALDVGAGFSVAALTSDMPAIPLPSSVLLLLGGLGALTVSGRRGRSAED